MNTGGLRREERTKGKGGEGVDGFVTVREAEHDRRHLVTQMSGKGFHPRGSKC